MDRPAAVKSLLIGLGLLLPLTARGGGDHRWTHFGLRPLGMGNAYVAVADDYNALFYNPAGLARLKDWHAEFLNPTLEVSARTIGFAKDLSKLSGGSASDSSEVLKTLSAQSGKTHHFAYYQTPFFVTQNWGFGLGLEVSASMAVHSDIDVAVDAGTKAILPIAFASNFLEDRLSLGMAVKFIGAAGIDTNVDLDTLSAFSKSDDPNATKLNDLFNAGYGIGADVGMLFTPIEPMEPTLGVSITDIGGTPFKAQKVGGKTVAAPPIRLPSVNTGVSIKPYKTEMSYVLLAVDAHSINQPFHYTHKLNLGAEWGFTRIIKIQCGMKDGYPTGGFQFDVGLLSLRLVTYTVDHAPIVGTNKDLAEQRYALQLKLLF